MDLNAGSRRRPMELRQQELDTSVYGTLRTGRNQQRLFFPGFPVSGTLYERHVETEYGRNQILPPIDVVHRGNTADAFRSREKPVFKIQGIPAPMNGKFAVIQKIPQNPQQLYYKNR